MVYETFLMCSGSECNKSIISTLFKYVKLKIKSKTYESLFLVMTLRNINKCRSKGGSHGKTIDLTLIKKHKKEPIKQTEFIFSKLSTFYVIK